MGLTQKSLSGSVLEFFMDSEYPASGSKYSQHFAIFKKDGFNTQSIGSSGLWPSYFSDFVERLSFILL
jgi:hypothetical protein